jgi:AcrR family transcriptional regulator
MDSGSNIARRRKTALSEGTADYKLKREEIVRAASKLFKARGYKGVTLAQVAGEAGVDRATLYYYVGSKEELLRESIEHVVARNALEAKRIFRTAGLSAQEKLLKLTQMLMCTYEEHYPQMYVYIQEEMHQVAAEKSEWARMMVRHTRQWETIFVKLVEEGIAQGQLRSDIPVGVAVNALFGMLNWTHRWFKPGGKSSAVEVANAFGEIFFKGMRPGSRGKKG